MSQDASESGVKSLIESHFFKKRAYEILVVVVVAVVAVVVVAVVVEVVGTPLAGNACLMSDGEPVGEHFFVLADEVHHDARDLELSDCGDP